MHCLPTVNPSEKTVIDRTKTASVILPLAINIFYKLGNETALFSVISSGISRSIASSNTFGSSVFWILFLHVVGEGLHPRPPPYHEGRGLQLHIGECGVEGLLGCRVLADADTDVLSHDKDGGGGI